MGKKLARRTFWGTAAGLVTLALGVAGLGEASEVSLRRPNIIMIVADDLGYGDLQSYGHPRIKTPNLDRLAAQGTRYTQHYMAHSVCSPSRSALLTGQYPSRWHVYAHFAWLGFNARRGMPDWLSLEAPSMPRLLQNAGYRTAHFGKWHLGGGSGRVYRGKAINSADAPPVKAYGFDEARMYVGNGPTWYGTERREEPHELYVVEDDEFMTHSSELIVDEAIEFMDKHAGDKPFMMNVWFHDPHVPLRPTLPMLEPYADVADPVKRGYYAVVSNIDRQVGRLLDHLETLDLDENTLVVFTSDNGAALPGTALTPEDINVTSKPIRYKMRDAAGSNGILRGWKWHLYEGGVRVPLIVRWPGHVPRGRVDSTSVLHATDFLPTFAHLAGVKLPSEYRADGEDVVRALEGKRFVRNKAIYWHNPTGWRRGPPLAIRDGDWKMLMERDGSNRQLFDLNHDPAEQHDLSSDRQEVVERLSKKLRKWQRSLPPPLERDYVEPVRGEAFNRVNLIGPNLRFIASETGAETTRQRDNRSLQFGVRFSF